MRRWVDRERRATKGELRSRERDLQDPRGHSERYKTHRRHPEEARDREAIERLLKEWPSNSKGPSR